MDTDIIRERYRDISPLYERLGQNLVNDIRDLFEDQGLRVHSITHRTKSFESFIEKMERKNYSNPFFQTEDISGVRIIYYFLSDLKIIDKIISEEFEIIEKSDKKAGLDDSSFGYRDMHYVVTIHDSWSRVPNYRKLKKLKVEIQVRTILMHAWDDIMHNLAYKKEEDIPSEFSRNLYRISAKLEETDEQFESLRKERNEYLNKIKKKAKIAKTFDDTLELNLDSLQAYLDFYFSDNYIKPDYSSKLLKDLNFHKSKTDMIMLVAYAKKYSPNKVEIESEICEVHGFTNLGQLGAARLMLRILGDEYWSRYFAHEKNQDIITKWKLHFNI